MASEVKKPKKRLNLDLNPHDDRLLNENLKIGDSRSRIEEVGRGLSLRNFVLKASLQKKQLIIRSEDGTEERVIFI